MGNHTYHDFLAHLGVGGAHPGGLALTRELLKGFPINHHRKVLDAGCGTGQTAAYLARTYDWEITALDQHPLMLEKARVRFEKENITVRLVEGKLENSPFPAESFDLIIAESVTIFTDIAKTAKEYVRLLKKGGMLLDLDMTAGTSFDKEEVNAFQDLYGITQIPTADEWKQIWQTAGFTSVETVMENSVAHQSPQDGSWTSPELNPSHPLDPFYYQIWDQHQLLTDEFSDKLKYSVYKVLKKE